MVQETTKLTSRKLTELLPKMMAKVEAKFNGKPQILLDAWPQIVGKELAPMTKADRFDEGILHIKVKNSTLLSLLSNPYDKKRLVEIIRKKFSGISIRNIEFRIG